MSHEETESSHTFLYITLVFILVIGLVVYKMFGPNTGSMAKGQYFYIHTGADYKTVLSDLEEGGFVKDMWSFRLFGSQSQLKTHVHPGRYQIKAGSSNFAIIRMLRSGKQAPVKIVINKLRTRKDLVNLLSTNLECTPDSLNAFLGSSEYLAQFDVDTNTLLSAIIPDTYDIFWNSSADKVFRKIQKNYNHFWDKVRTEKAKNKGLSPLQITILASIVEEETNSATDKPLVASVYLNRLKKGMKLQADPTVKFAVGDFMIRRVAGDMLKSTSPYNTYQVEGLPPGPICTPSAATIMAVLDAPETGYYYFCAKADFSGNSAFAATLDEQMKNAREYQKALNERGIH
jgi:UPF0755 protein